MFEFFTILVVDDNAGNRYTLRELLGKLAGVKVIEAASGEEALRRCVEFDIQLILLDVQMPGMDGYETAKILQMTERTRSIPIVFLTAVFKAEEFVQRGYAVGAVDYLTKPLDDNMLLNRVRNYQHLQDREMRLTEALHHLRITQEHLLQSQKLSALGSLVAGVSHELNTPLGNAKLAVSTMRDRMQEVSRSYEGGTLTRNKIMEFFGEGSDIVDLAFRSVDRATELVTNFKQVALDQTSEKRRQFDLAAVVQETLATMRPGFRDAPWQFAVDVEQGILMDSYPGPLERVIYSIINNSIRHGFEGREHGLVTIQGASGPVARNNGPQVVLTVADDGVGIAPQYLSRVFDPFFTTTLGRGGSGIGLNIAHRITTSVLGGVIEVASPAGGGTTFRLTLPTEAPQPI